MELVYLLMNFVDGPRGSWVAGTISWERDNRYDRRVNYILTREVKGRYAMVQLSEGDLGDVSESEWGAVRAHVRKDFPSHPYIGGLLKEDFQVLG